MTNSKANIRKRTTWTLIVAVPWTAIMWMGLVQVGPVWLVHRAPTVFHQWDNVTHAGTILWAIGVGVVAWGLNALGQSVWARSVQKRIPKTFGEFREDTHIKARALSDAYQNRRLWFAIQKNVLGPVGEEIVARWLPLFAFATVPAVILVLIGGSLWCVAHYSQVQRRTLWIRMRMLSVSAVVYLLAMIAVYSATGNTIAALVAASLAHILHNVLVTSWPGYLQWVTRFTVGPKAA